MTETRTCQERERLLHQLHTSFDDFSAAVRELRQQNGGSTPRPDKSERSESARIICEKAWADLREHQNKHRCWP